MICAVIPAHNEGANLAATVESLRGQTVPVDILVVSDNSTDDTVSVARSLGVRVIETVGNTARKAGALNYALSTIQGDYAYVLPMDADTVLAPTFVETALQELQDPKVGGVGAVFHAAAPTSYLELCQHLEWTRYAEETDRTGKTFVMSGTAALVRWIALESVRVRFGHWYDESTITEDSRLSIDLKLCGWELRSPVACATITETMPSFSALFYQRRRWYLGALQNVVDTGLNRITLPYWKQQILLGLSVLLMSLYLTLTAVAVIVGGLFAPEFLWLAIGGVFVVERVVTVWDEPLRYRLFAAALFPELLYSLVLQASYVSALFQKVTGSAGTWTHITPKEA